MTEPIVGRVVYVPLATLQHPPSWAPLAATTATLAVCVHERGQSATFDVERRNVDPDGIRVGASSYSCANLTREGAAVLHAWLTDWLAS